MNIQAILGGAKVFLIRNNAAIMTGVGIAGVPVTAYLSGKATLKASKELEKMKYESEKEPTFSEKAKTVAPIFIPPVMAAVTTMGCIYGANSVNARRIAALAGAYSMSESAFKDYKDKVVEIAGNKKAEDIRDSIEIDKVQQNPPREEAIENTGNGQTLIYDRVMGSYFRSDMQSVREAVNDLNEDLMADGYACLNDFYTYLGRKTIDLGEELGWCYEPTHETLEVLYTSTLTDSGTPVMVISYNLTPIYVKTGAWSKA